MSELKQANGQATAHYLTEEVDPILLRGACDFLIPFVKPGRVLNVGVGYGVWDERLSELPGELHALDFDEKLIEHFKSKFPRSHYICADAFKYSPERPFDTIVASHFLEHIDEPVELLKRFKNWLAPDGVLLIVVPNAESIHRQIGLKMGLLQQLTDLNDTDKMLGHKRVYTADLLKSQIEASGLKIEKICGVTLKTMSNAQLASMPRNYLDACTKLSEELGQFACQIAAVISR